MTGIGIGISKFFGGLGKVKIEDEEEKLLPRAVSVQEDMWNSLSKKVENRKLKHNKFSRRIDNDMVTSEVSKFYMEEVPDDFIAQ